MNKLLILTLLCCLSLGIMCCSNPQTDENQLTETTHTATKNSNLDIFHSKRNDSLYQLVVFKHDESMIVHDDEMPNIKRTLTATYEQEANQDKKEEIMQCLKRFNKASEDMFAWMRAFKGIDLYDEDYQAMQEEEIWNYLKEEEAKIELVATQIDSAVIVGNALLVK